MASPLEGIRVLDFTHVWAGPACTRILADLGAEVLKVEGMSYIDMTRNLWFLNNDTSGEFWNRSPYFQNRNQNKLSMGIDLSKEESRALVRRLVPHCDVIVENFTPRVMPGWGMDFATLSGINPRLVMVSMSGYGATGSFSNYLAFGMSLNASTGLASGNGYPGGRPMKSGTAFMDPFAGAAAAAAVIAGLIERESTGHGQWIDLSQHEIGMALIGEWFVRYGRTKQEPTLNGSRSEWHAPQGIYPCRGDDDWIYMSVRNEEEWRSLCAELACPDLERDSRFSTVRNRLLNHDALDEQLATFTRDREKFKLMARLQDRGIIAAALLDGAEVLENEQFRSRGMFEEVELDGEPYLSHRYVAARFDRFSSRTASRAPRLGEHNEYVLRELCGLSAREVAELEDAGLIGTEPQFALPLDRMRRSVRFPVDDTIERGTAKRIGAASRGAREASTTEEEPGEGR